MRIVFCAKIILESKGWLVSGFVLFPLPPPLCLPIIVLVNR